jgi:hypothetical protein
MIPAAKIPESKARYICKVGILRWALPLYVLFMIMETFMVRRRHPQDFTLVNMVEIAIFALVIWLITGWIFGSILWRRRQKLSQDVSNERN